MPSKDQVPRWRKTGGILLAMALVAALVALAAPAGATFKGHNGQIAYVPDFQPFTPGEIWTADPDGTNAQKLVDLTSPAGYYCAGWSSGSATGPKWSPDGTRIAFGNSSDLWVMAADGTGLTQLTAIGTERIGSPVWSPDGSRIAVVIDLVLYVVEVFGGSTIAIPSDHGGWFSDFSPPTWSKNGAEIAAVIEQWGAGPHDVYVIAADGSSQVNITNDGIADHPAWSPNGKEIAFTSYEAGSTPRVEAIRPDGSKRRTIVDLPTPDFWPQWSPNGSSLLFTSYDGWNFLVLVHITKPHGKKVIDLPSGNSICDAVWSPDGSRILFIDHTGNLWTVDRRVRTDPQPLLINGQLPDWQSVSGRK